MNIFQKLFSPKQTPIETTLTITSNNGFHLRPIAEFANEVKQFKCTITIVAKNQEVPAIQVPKILTLALDKNESFILKCVGNDAEEASDHLLAFFHQLMQDDVEVVEIKQESEAYEALTYTGITIAKGIGIAPLIDYEIIEGNHDGLPLQDAIKKTKEELSNLYEKNKTKAEAKIFLAQKELLDSELFEKNFDTINEEIEKLKGTKFESRMADYQDLKQRILAYMGRATQLKLPNTSYILLADDLLPSEVNQLSQTQVKGVILTKGTLTSHASILLRSYGIPSLIIADKISSGYPNTLLDANSGNLILEPTDNDLKKAQQKQQAFQVQQQQSFDNRFQSTQTQSGKIIKILANIADVASAQKAKEQGADGIGLLRTEFLFTEVKPTLEEQTQAYKSILELFDEVTIRTLDIGGDKSLPYIDISKEDNPFLGVRGLRYSLQEQTLFKEQLLAIYQAVGSILSNKKNIKIMFPMVSTPNEFIQAKTIALEVAKEHRLSVENIQFGIMLEVTSVIFALKEFDQLVDFYSIGTNDLTQYLFAIERTHPTLKINPTSPILFNALRQIIETTQKPISICGELAGLEEATQHLIDMGYDTLSVSANLIPSLKERIRNV